MFGTITEWYYRWLAGIRPDPDQPGFKTFYIGPSIPKELEFVNCSYNSPFGEIVSNWKKMSSGSVRYEMKIPTDSHANIVLPLEGESQIIVEKEGIAFEPDKIKGLQTGNFKLDEGEYIITVTSKN